MLNFIVRSAELKDSEGIAKVQVETWQAAYKGHVPDSYLRSLSVEKRKSRWKEILSHPKENAKTYVAVADNQIIGFCSVSHCRDKTMPSYMGELWAIYVDPNYMNQGVGGALLEEGLTYLRKQNFKEAVLWVLTSNSHARKWYESKGWRFEGKEIVDNSHGVEMRESRYIINL